MNKLMLNPLNLQKGEKLSKNLKEKQMIAGITQRKDGRYVARINYNGKRKEKTFWDYEDALQWKIINSASSELKDVTFNGTMTLNNWYEQWLRIYKKNSVRESTYERYQNIYEWYIRNTLGDLKLVDLKPLYISELLAELEENNYSKSTCKSVRTLLNQMLDHAVDNNFILKNPVNKSVKVNAKKKKEIKALTSKEIMLFFNGYEDKPTYWQCMILLNTGLRFGELVALRWEDIDFRNKKIYIKHAMTNNRYQSKLKMSTPKTDNGIREIPMTDICVDMFMKQKKYNQSLPKVNINTNGYIFLNRYGNVRCHGSIAESITIRCNEVGIRHLTPHMFRHTFATLCIKNGMTPKTLQVILGHSTIRTTMDVYVHETEGSLAKEMKMVENYLQVAK